MSIQKSAEIQSVQLLRGIAAFMVLMNHAHDVKSIPDASWVKQVLEYGNMGVNIFFVISGFILPWSMYRNNYQISDFRIFFLKRVIRIEPPYLVSAMLVLFLGYANTIAPWYKGPPFSVNWWNVAGHVGYLNAFTGVPWLNQAYWTLAVEFEFYLVLALLYPLLTHKSKPVLVVAFLLLLAAAFIPVPPVHIVTFLPFFLSGICLFLLQSGKIGKKLFAILLLPTLLIIYLNFSLILVCIAMAALLGIYFIRRVPAPFLFLGTISYSLYLTHGVIVTRFMGLTDRFLPWANIWFQFLLCILFCLGFAALYYFTVERFFVTLSKKIRYRHRNQQEEKTADLN